MNQRIIEIFTANDHANADIRVEALKKLDWAVTKTTASRLTVNENTNPTNSRSFIFNNVILLEGTKP